MALAALTALHEKNVALHLRVTTLERELTELERSVDATLAR